MKKELSEKELLKSALDHMAEALCFLYETKLSINQSIAFMLDSTIKLGTVILNDGNILDASANYQEYEMEMCHKRINEKKISENVIIRLDDTLNKLKDR